MPENESSLKWTQKTELSSRIVDPLGMYALKFLERYFLAGITTQTERLRYYSFIAWAWKTISDENLERKKILNMEKVATLAAAYHHFNDGKPPNGIRNRREAEAFIDSRYSFNVNRFVNYGVNNRTGYGNFYYKGPLVTLRICAKIDDDIITSVKGSYKKAIATLEFCSTYDIETVIHFTPMKVNYKELHHVLDLYWKFNPKSIKIFNFSAQGRGLNNKALLKLSPAEQAEFINQVLSLRKEKEIRFDFGGEIIGLNVSCSVGKKLVVTSDGKVVPCLGLRANAKYVIGDIREKNLSEIWVGLESLASNKCLCG